MAPLAPPIAPPMLQATDQSFLQRAQALHLVAQQTVDKDLSTGFIYKTKWPNCDVVVKLVLCCF